MRIKRFLIFKQPKNYSQVPYFCHRSGNRTDPEKKDQNEMQMKLAKRPSQLVGVEDSDRPLDAPLAKPSLQPCLSIWHVGIVWNRAPTTQPPERLWIMSYTGPEISWKVTVRPRRQRTTHRSDQLIQYHHWEGIQDLLAVDWDFLHTKN